MRYRVVSPGRLLLVVDPWAGRGPFGERRLAAALRAGAEELTKAEGLKAVAARPGSARELGHRLSRDRWRRKLAL